MTRQRYVVTLSTDSPLLLGRTQATSNYRQTDVVISGKTWRGAVAESLRRHNYPLFEQLFHQPETEQIYFGTIIPVRDSRDSPPPPTCFTCKHKPGEHGFFDTLARQYALELALQVSIPDWIDQMCCPVCGGEAEADTNLVTDKEVRTLATTHTAINRRRRVAEDRLLYTQEGALIQTTKAKYVGWVDIPKSLFKPFEAFISQTPHLQIGGSRSRGMGSVRVESLEPFQPTKLQDRLESFNRTLHRALRFYQVQSNIDYPALASTEENRFFTLNLRGEAIFLRYGQPEPDPVLPDDIRIVGRWINWNHVSGWHNAAGLPRRTQMSVSGVYLCHLDNNVDLDRLAALESQGVGERREQGYGQVLICDPIHYLNTGIGD